jgi:sugar lactone lactonase YvrE
MAPARILFAPVDEADRFLPEGPHGVAVAGRLALAWVNIQSATASKTGAVHLRFWDTGEHRILRQSARPGFIVPTDRPGVVLVGREKELGTLDLQTGEWKTLARIPDANPRTIINDGAAVPGGRAVVFGTKDTQFKDPIAALYLYTVADRRLTVLAEGQVCSNGKIFGQDADGLTLYDIDTPRRVVSRYRFDLDRRSLQVDGVAVDLRTVDGFPDGMVGVPRAAGSPGDGTAIIAMYNPGPVADGRAYHYHLGNGQRLSEWIVPGSPRVTCPLLVERDGGVKLVLTTAVEGMPAEQRRESPNAGSLFEADTDLKRVPPVELVCLG